jgi:hypothetical protein
MNRKKIIVRIAGVAVVLLLVQGCTAVTKIESVSPGTTLMLNSGERLELPKTVSAKSQSVGQLEFMALTPGGKPFYGLLPLRVSGGKMTGSILLFAPALFIGGFRDAFPFYQIDPEAGELRYKRNAEDEWRAYKPSTAESERAKAHFDLLAAECGDVKAKKKRKNCPSDTAALKN